MAKMTKAQREWRPGQKKPRRSIKAMFAVSVLSIEAFIVFFATLAVFGILARDWGTTQQWLLVGGGVLLTLVFLLACGMVRRPGGYVLGWVLQLVLIATGFLLPAMFVIGALCALAWWYAVAKGTTIDRENRERDRLQEQWEAEHPQDRA
ncbi:hypothetical protein CKW39_11290 [Kocuria sp. WRN011]|uniref:DUF4233 domain-containing protein n=1 Tax=Kocuria carniphila TaxID=262208 RepID=A0ABV3UZ43_9MICC|nr:DUF4233 domain-containing protein [Kocuria sp. WRN011]PBB07908.1 hypothetical protein CKW39_11290 [Kocuria sp. WRN011]